MAQKSNKSSLFLIELIVGLLFFSLCSAVCVQLFARAHLIKENTAQLNKAITLSQSVAEIFRSAGGSSEALVSYLDGAVQNGQEILFAPEENVRLTVTITNRSENLANAKIQYEYDGVSIYELDVTSYNGSSGLALTDNGEGQP